jgi:hypothetical protein
VYCDPDLLLVNAELQGDRLLYLKQLELRHKTHHHSHHDMPKHALLCVRHCRDESLLVPPNASKLAKAFGEEVTTNWLEGQSEPAT